MWHSDIIDENGENMEAFIQEMGIIVLNEPGNPSTFATTRGESNINVTIASNKAVRGVKDWAVQGNWITSDHRAITFEFSNDVIQRRPSDKYLTSKFAVERADWHKFEISFANKVKGMIE